MLVYKLDSTNSTVCVVLTHAVDYSCVDGPSNTGHGDTMGCTSDNSVMMCYLDANAVSSMGGASHHSFKASLEAPVTYSHSMFLLSTSLL